jgi:serine/threonine protein kinase
MSEVYRARDTRLDRTVAIKVLAGTLAADPQFRQRFDREARAISQLAQSEASCPRGLCGTIRTFDVRRLEVHDRTIAHVDSPDMTCWS